jgi:hypothetical protein
MVEWVYGITVKSRFATPINFGTTKWQYRYGTGVEVLVRCYDSTGLQELVHSTDDSTGLQELVHSIAFLLAFFLFVFSSKTVRHLL